MREEQAIHNLDQKEDPAVYFLTELQWTLHAALLRRTGAITLLPQNKPLVHYLRRGEPQLDSWVQMD